MASWRWAIGLGLLVWLIPFGVAFAAFPLKEGWRSLFESIMPVTVAAVVTPLALLYFRRTGRWNLREGACLGLLWWAMSMAIDLPLMLPPPISYALAEYFADIGLTYLMMPIITLGIAAAGSRTEDSPRG